MSLVVVDQVWSSDVVYHCGGLISPTNTAQDFKRGTAKLEPFPIPWFGCANEDITPSTPVKPQTTFDLLISFIERWRHWESSRYTHVNHDIYDGFSHIARKLHDLGFLPDDEKFYLWHGDLDFRNVMGRVKGPDEVEVTGIIDWDAAAFVPKFMSKRAPFFLWLDGEEDLRDENFAFALPDSEDAEYKRMFWDMADKDYLRYAFAPEYVVARGLFQLLQRGLGDCYDNELAKKLIADFEKKYPRA